MKLNHFILFLFLPFAIQTKAQNYTRKQIDSLIESTKVLSDQKKAIKIGLEAYKQAEKLNYGKGKMDALNNIIYEYGFMGNDKKTIEYSNKLIKIAQEEKNYYYEIRAMLGLCYVYVYASFYQKSQETAEEAERLAYNLEGDEFYMTMGEIYQFKSTLEGFKKNMKQQLYSDKKALSYFSEIKKANRRDHFVFSQYLNITISYLDVNKKDSAIYYARKAYDFSKINADPMRKIEALFGMADVFFTIDKKDSAIYYYKKVAPLLIKTHNPKKLEIVYNNMATMYEKLGDTKNYIYYSKMALAITKNNRDLKKLTVNQVSNDIVANEKNEKIKQITLIVSGFVILILAIIFFTIRLSMRYKKIKELKRTTEISLIEKYEKQLQEKLEIRNSEKETAKVSQISDEKELELMKKLNNFERKEQFLSSEITLGSLASTFGTNVNYLSKVIKKYRDNNFNGYINDLRITYITKKLRTNPEYLNYKIAYLSEECGFSSYSSFVSIFKQQTGLTPSKFIEYLSKEEQNGNQK
ncbi:response regulator transcription factor [Epilithonimonas xixisoli]|uniref:AraC-like DNA-binding protein n=1 Tax=Epilithonimonas xixisoli TaxID=1476462 RepID=A0A4V3H318_9FLAO|nr:response regulator transcription factor [Epilithonimonas xixisoli]TDX87251.1 AraC-like DNA-binding protein [Epilithonimonas xixisoli]